MKHNNLAQETIRQIKATHITPAEVAHHMLQIWESKISADQPLALISKRKESLNWLATHVFCSSLANWSDFVDLVADNAYLMSMVKCKGIDWIIEARNCQDILAGKYRGGGYKIGGDESCANETDGDAADGLASADNE